MKLSLNWLNDFVSTKDIDIKTLCDRLTMTGSKVEGYEELGEGISNVAVGRILEIRRHPNAERLVICLVDIGADKPVQIVTAATNVFEGALVPVALDGAHLHGDIKIKTSKLRGEISEGMFCSVSELGLTIHDMPGAIEDGILIFDHTGLGHLKPGDDVVKELRLRDTVVDFEITSNRPDCLSVIGLARETAVTFERPCFVPAPSVSESSDGDTVGNYLSVGISNTEKCYRYSAKVVKNVKIGPSPLWMRMKLRASGVRPINNIVDITNYVMLEYGQPMHAFDYKCLDGSEIDVRSAYDGEEFISLDSIPHKLDGSMLVISDSKKAVALAGVMGGENSEIKDDTSTVVFESATFHAGSVRLAAKKLGMRTESSSRFEKGLDSENTVPALNRACELVELLGAGEVVNGLIDVYPQPKKQVVMPLQTEKINAFLGLDLSRERMADILSSLGFELSDDLLTFKVPTYRDDVRCMNDVAEEVLRIYGYDKISSTLSNSSTVTVGLRTDRQSFDMTLHDALTGMGINEIQTFSFISPSYYDKIRLSPDDPRRNCVVISNPLGEDTSVMRTTTIPSMMKVLSDNYNMKNTDIKLFDMSRAYIPTGRDTLPDEPARLTIGFIGKDAFYRLKGYVDAVLKTAGVVGYSYESCSDEPSFHPGRCAIVKISGTKLALFGEMHPEVSETYGISPAAYVAEIYTDAVYDNRRKAIEYRQIPKHPAVERDFSFVCDENIESGAIVDAIKSASPLVESVKLFDVYRGAPVEEGKKSMSYSVNLRSNERTLDNAEAQNAVNKILDNLEKQLNIKLR